MPFVMTSHWLSGHSSLVSQGIVSFLGVLLHISSLYPTISELESTHRGSIRPGALRSGLFKLAPPCDCHDRKGQVVADYFRQSFRAVVLLIRFGYLPNHGVSLQRGVD